jgi:hypothetical protein
VQLADRYAQGPALLGQLPWGAWQMLSTQSMPSPWQSSPSVHRIPGRTRAAPHADGLALKSQRSDWQASSKP